MIRERGQDPGIHIHSDITDLDIFANLREERVDLVREAEEEAAAQAAKMEKLQRAKRAMPPPHRRPTDSDITF